VFKIAWGKNGTPETLGGTADTMTISDQTSTTFNTVMMSANATTHVALNIRLGNSTIDTGSNYAGRISSNGGADSTATSRSSIETSSNTLGQFQVSYIVNISAEEKLVIGVGKLDEGTLGAGTAPNRVEYVGKWVNTSNQFDNVQSYNDEVGDYTANSNISALGTD